MLPAAPQVIQTTAACNATTPVVPKPARELQLLIQGVPGTGTAGMFVIVSIFARGLSCMASLAVFFQALTRHLYHTQTNHTNPFRPPALLQVVCPAGQKACTAHRVTPPPPPPTIYFEPIALAQKPTGPSFDVSSDLLASPQLPAALRGDNSVRG